jgi:pimeloyl-ACP methyl ester carboxylesterase
MTDGLLLVHAFPLDARMWDEQLTALAGVVPTVAVDLPGFGGTALEGDVTTMPIAARRCLDGLDRAGLDRAVVCGLSMGGYVALELWRSRRERVAGLVLANTRAEPDDDAAKKRRRLIAETVRSEGMVAILDSQRALVSPDVADDVWERVASIVASQPPEAVAAMSLGLAERPDSRPDLPTVDVPALVITSTDDQLIAPELSKRMAEAIPDAEMAVVEGAGHLPNMERPDEFTGLLIKHLERCGVAA